MVDNENLSTFFTRAYGLPSRLLNKQYTRLQQGWPSPFVCLVILMKTFMFVFASFSKKHRSLLDGSLKEYYWPFWQARTLSINSSGETRAHPPLLLCGGTAVVPGNPNSDFHFYIQKKNTAMIFTHKCSLIFYPQNWNRFSRGRKMEN